MRFDPAIVFTTGHVLNEQMSATLARGFNGTTRPACERHVYAAVNGARYEFVPVEPEKDALNIVYGILRGTGEILKDCERIGADYIYCDHTYFDQYRSNMKEAKFDGYFRLVPNDRYFRPSGRVPSDRWDKLDIRLRPWRKDGKHIVLVPVSRFVADYQGFDPQEWLHDTVKELRQHTDRRIVIKPKDTQVPFAKVLEGAWAVVTHESNAAVQAIINGVPAFTGVSAAAAPMACQDFSLIENPPMPDREAHLHQLAYQQFTREEIRNGTAKRVLEEQFS